MLSVTSKRIIALSTTAAVALGSCGGVMIYKNNQNKVLAQELTSEIAEAQDLAAQAGITVSDEQYEAFKTENSITEETAISAEQKNAGKKMMRLIPQSETSAHHCATAPSSARSISLRKTGGLLIRPPRLKPETCTAFSS